MSKSVISHGLLHVLFFLPETPFLLLCVLVISTGISALSLTPILPGTWHNFKDKVICMVSYLFSVITIPSSHYFVISMKAETIFFFVHH